MDIPAVDPAVEFLNLAKAWQANPQDVRHATRLYDLAVQHDMQEEWQELATELLDEVNEPAARAPMLELCARALPPSAASAELLNEAADIYNQLQRPEEALSCYQNMLAIVPKHPMATGALADVYFRRGNWPDAKALYQNFVEYTEASHADMALAYYRLGYINEKLDDKHAAAACFKQAVSFQPGNLAALEGLAQSLSKLAQWEEAGATYEAILLHHQKQLSASEVADLQWQLGSIAQQLQQFDKAYRQYERVLSMAPLHPLALKAAGELDLQMGRWALAVERLCKYTEVTRAEGNLDILLQLAKVSKERLQDVKLTVQLLERAKAIMPPRHVHNAALLQQLGEAYLESNLGHEASAVWQSALDHMHDAGERAALLERLGDLSFETLQNHPQALLFYNAALDAWPMQATAFQKLARHLTQQQDWQGLEVNLRAMVGRPGLTVPMREILWRDLAELYNGLLLRPSEARQAYEVVMKLAPNGIDDGMALTKLYSQNKDDAEALDKAIALQQRLLTFAPNPTLHLRTLRRLYHKRQNFDAVFLMCQALVTLQQAQMDEIRVYDYLLRGMPQRASRSLNARSWYMLGEAPLRGPIAQLASVLAEVAPGAKGQSLRSFGLHRRDKVTPKDKNVYFLNLLNYMTEMLQIPQVNLYVKKQTAQELQLLPVASRAMLIGAENRALANMPDIEVLFQLASCVAKLRPEVYLAATLGGQNLRNLLFGLCLSFDANLRHAGDAAQVMTYQKKFTRLPVAAKNALQPLAEAAYGELLLESPYQAYLQACERLSLRVGLVMAHNLPEITASLLRQGQTGALSAAEKVKELLLFSVSPAYQAIREQLATNIVVKG